MELYLRSVMKAEAQVAQDCAQSAFEKVYSRLQEGSIGELENIYGYCITTARNEFLMHQRIAAREQPFDERDDEHIDESPADNVIEVFQSEQREKALNQCISKLKPKRKQFFLRILNHINHSEKEAADLLGMGYAQYRTKKSRIIAALRKCVDKLLAK